jgi:glycosyltransferase involved in cell wall biosynthesis
MSLSTTPKVSITLPVYNGEKFLKETIESLLGQDFTDFELILCDNASTDRTAEICQEYADRDPRVVYYRNSHNIGMTANFNKAIDLARGEYIKIATHDDLIAPNFLSACVEVLDRDPSLILCHTDSKVIDGAGQVTTGLNGKIEACVQFMNSPSLPEMNSPKAWVRFYAHTCKALTWTQEFGLIRHDIFYKAGKWGAFFANDKVLVANLALLGRFYTIHQPLFFYRRHEGQSINMGRSKHIYALWFSPDDTGKLIFPSWRILHEYWKGIQQARLNPIDKALCILCLIPAAIKDIVGLTEDIVVALIQILDRLLRSVTQLIKGRKIKSPQTPLFGRIPRLGS